MRFAKKRNWVSYALVRRKGTIMITLAAASQKGGVAKTTTNLAIGAKLVEDGARVLYVDLDPQMNLSTTLKAQTAGVLSSLDVLTGDATVADAAQSIDG